MATVDPVLIAGAIQTNATVALSRDGATVGVPRRVAFSFGVSITSLPTDDRMTGFGAVERAEAIDDFASAWMRGDMLAVQAFDGHVDAAGTPILPEITSYLVTAVRRFPGALPIVVLSLTGTPATA